MGFSTSLQKFVITTAAWRRVVVELCLCGWVGVCVSLEKLVMMIAVWRRVVLEQDWLHDAPVCGGEGGGGRGVGNG